MCKGKDLIGQENSQCQNEGWKAVAERCDSDYELSFFESRFNVWQRQVILLTEISYAKTYTYVTPQGIFTHIGTLARALQHIFQKDWSIHAALVGNELSFIVGKGIKDVSHSFVCKFVELDQAFSDMHKDGWKFNNAFEFAIPRTALVPMASCLLDMATDQELEGCSQHVKDRWYSHAEEKGENKIVLSMRTGEMLFGTPESNASARTSNGKVQKN